MGCWRAFPPSQVSTFCISDLNIFGELATVAILLSAGRRRTQFLCITLRRSWPGHVSKLLYISVYLSISILSQYLELSWVILSYLELIQFGILHTLIKQRVSRGKSFYKQFETFSERMTAMNAFCECDTSAITGHGSAMWMLRISGRTFHASRRLLHCIYMYLQVPFNNILDSLLHGVYQWDIKLAFRCL